MKHVFVGLMFGDEGKARVIDEWVRKTGANFIARYNGGSQPAHHVVLKNGVWHCFSLFGSGTFVGNTRTFLSRFVLVDPLSIEAEAEVLQNKGVLSPFSRLQISPDCTVITPFHVIVNQMRETARSDGRYGSCGKGVGEALSDRKCLGQNSITVADLGDASAITEKLMFQWRQKIDVAEQLVDQNPGNAFLAMSLRKLKRNDFVDRLVVAYQSFSRKITLVSDDQWLKSLSPSESVGFEGAQGTLLDPEFGFAPFVTKTKTTTANAHVLSQYDPDTIVYGITRGYATRHGAGPFPSFSSCLTSQIPDVHNIANPWQGEFRVGWLDVIGLRYALKVNGGVDRLIVTNLDRLFGRNDVQICVAYQPPDHLLEKDLSTMFDLLKDHSNGFYICGISAPRNSVEQAEMTTVISQCRPVYHNFGNLSPDNVNKYLDLIEKLLDTPIAFATVGPTAFETIARTQ